MLKDFTTNKILIGTFLFVLTTIVIVGLLGEFPFCQFIEIDDRKSYLFALHAGLFPIEITVIGFAIRDLFSGDTFTKSKLWGAAAVYLMIGISFASLYDLINIVSPGILREPLLIHFFQKTNRINNMQGILFCNSQSYSIKNITR